MARELQPDLVILDLMLPKKSGVEVLALSCGATWRSEILPWS